MDNNLKDYREKELKNYVIGNALIIIVLLGIFNTLLDVKMDESTNNILLTLSSEIISAGIFSSILYTYVFILDAIIPGNWKDSICNLCRPLPGEIIFEEIREKANDKRFTKEKALQKYANIYEIIDNLIGKENKNIYLSTRLFIMSRFMYFNTIYWFIIFCFMGIFDCCF